MTWESFAKNRNVDWQIQKDDKGNYPTHSVNRCIMMDIRAELVRLNAVMQCPNVAAGFRALAHVARDEKAFKRRVAAAVRRELKKRAKS